MPEFGVEIPGRKNPYLPEKTTNIPQRKDSENASKTRIHWGRNNLTKLSMFKNILGARTTHDEENPRDAKYSILKNPQPAT